ncbi:30S ribosomal protein S6 [Endomicrobiia bacterium]|nr:30S ribosomal protein S6 [Endomicrobiia bacterium]GHT63651.1 30S ribosomal protein S6 [Endomicrobiia bacterium]GHT70643.1 30S ribosomal protein S6 [Endomicrobiia bacterium]GHT75583.1 30S ribosomal protein S6 [Endomicrobiia bacterium]
MNYESTFIASPELPVDKIEELTTKVVKTIEASQGIAKTIQQMGRKRLAYPINKFNEGSYVYMELSGNGEMVNALENFFKFNSSVIRFLTIKIEKKKTVVKPAKAEVVVAKSQATEEVKQNGSATEQSPPAGAE